MVEEKLLLAQAWKTDCYSEVVPAGGGTPIKVATIKGFECIFANVLNIVVRFAGIALFVMLLIGGFKYLISGGDPKKSQSAQQTLTYAIIGLIVILGAWIVFLLIKQFTGVDVLNFEIVTGQ